MGRSFKVKQIFIGIGASLLCYLLYILTVVVSKIPFFIPLIAFSLVVIFAIQSFNLSAMSLKLISFLISLIMLFVIGVKFDFWHGLFAMIHPEYGQMNAGSGFAYIMLTSIYFIVLVISILTSIIVSLIRKSKNTGD